MRKQLIATLAVVGAGFLAAIAAAEDPPAEVAHDALPGALVDDDAHGAAPHGDAHGEDHAEPNIFAGDIGNVIVTLLIFGLVIYILHRYAWPHILGGLQQREETIRDSLESARRERAAAEKLLADHRRQMDEARGEAARILEDARRDAEATGRRLQDEARAEANRMIERAREEIGLARDAAVKDLYDHTADLAVTVASEVVEKSLSVEDHRELVDKALERMKSSDVKLN